MKTIALIAASLLALAACESATNTPLVPSVPPVAPSKALTELPKPAPQPSVDVDKKDQYYRNCSEAKDAGAAPLRQGVDEGYRSALDRDKDGIACD